MSDFQHSYAPVVGINDYSNGICTLKTAVSDATEIARLLESQHNYTVYPASRSRSYPQPVAAGG